MNKIKYIAASLSLFTLLSARATAQESTPADAEEKTGTAMPKIALSLNGGMTFSYTDVKPQKTGILIGIGAAYFATPYLHVNLDVQKGWLKGGEKIDASGLMGSDNSFFSVSLTGRFLPFSLLKGSNSNAGMKILSGIYGGIGVGFVSNSVESNTIISPEFGSLGSYSGLSFMVPIEGGINIPVAEMANNKRILINLNYRINLCMSDKIDGYVPVVDANKKNDAYNQLTAGIIFNF